MAGLPSGDRPGETVHGAAERQQEGDELAARSFSRHQIARARLLAAARRDDAAQARDRAAEARDAAAEERSIETAALDVASQQDEDLGELDGADAIVRAAGQRKRSARRRAHDARQRELAAADRHAAALDREEARRERLEALEDRDAFAAELREEQERRRQALRHQVRAEALARTLQRSLSPPSLPAVAGLDVAVHYEPFAAEDVGGDFYDLFPLTGGRSGFFLGDVCGKGPEAATLTSLARYTMRTAAMLREQPDAILMDLNAALRVAGVESMMQSCTAVYGEIDMNGGASVITLAVAGHPPPLVVRARGDVEATAAQGMMLGIVDEPTFTTCRIALEPGDTIFAYTDGILDTTIDGVRVDKQRLGGLLLGAPEVSAQALVDRIVLALRHSDHPLRDDVALMALRRTPPVVNPARRSAG